LGHRKMINDANCVVVAQVQDLAGEIRPALSAHVNNVQRLAENEVSEIFSSTGELVGCPRVNAAYFEMKSAFCCEVRAGSQFIHWLS
jgi:hypothetical protein